MATFSEAKDDALKLVGRSGENTLPLDEMIRWQLQELARRHRWFWRKRTLTFSTVAGTATYDLSSTTTVPTSAGKDVDEVVDVFYVNGTEVSQLQPAWGDDVQALAAAQTDRDTPASWMIEPGASQTLRIMPIPAAVYSLRVNFWGVPYFAHGDSTDAIPYLPTSLHGLLALGLARDIAISQYDAADERYMGISRRYENWIMQALKNDAGMTRKVLTSNVRGAIRSTR